MQHLLHSDASLSYLESHSNALCVVIISAGCSTDKISVIESVTCKADIHAHLKAGWPANWPPKGLMLPSLVSLNRDNASQRQDLWDHEPRGRGLHPQGRE